MAKHLKVQHTFNIFRIGVKYIYYLMFYKRLVLVYIVLVNNWPAFPLTTKGYSTDESR